MQIREIPSASALSDRAEKIPLFLTDLWSNSAGDGYKRYGIFSGKNNDKLIGAFALFHYTKIGTKIHITPPAAPSIGLFLVDQKNTKYASQTTLKRVLRSVSEFLGASFPKDYLDIALPPSFVDMQPFQEGDYEVKVAYTYLLNLQGHSEEKLLSAMSPERRKNIRDAVACDYSVEFNPEHSLVLELIGSTLSEQGVVFHEELFQKLLTSGSEHIFSVAVFDGNQMVSAVVVGTDDDAAYYLAGGTEKSQSIAGPFGLWKALLKAQSVGADKFDFLGSSVPSIERYFRGFGGELTPYFHIRKNTALIDFLKSTKDRFR